MDLSGVLEMRRWLLWLVTGLLLLGCEPPTAVSTPLPPTPIAALPSSQPTAVPPTHTAEPSPTPSPTTTQTASPPPLPTATVSPTASPTVTRDPPPTAVSPAQFINDLPRTDFLWLPPETIAHVQETYQRGQREHGRVSRRFSKIGDSLVAHPGFLTMFDSGAYELGRYAPLQPTIDYYAGSFARYGVGLKPGLSSFGILDPFWADKEWCNPNEHLLDCEIRLYNPSILLIQMGTNDANASFERNMRQVINHALDQGVVPVLITKADRFEGDNRNNESLYRLATELHLPLVDFDLVAGTLHGRGLREDQAHLTIPPRHDYTQDSTLTYGHAAHNLALLMMLTELHHILTP